MRLSDPAAYRLADKRLLELELRYCHVRELVAMLLATVLLLLFGAAALVLGTAGHEWLAGCVFTTTVLGVGTIFVLRERPVVRTPVDNAQSPAMPTGQLTPVPPRPQ